MKKKSNAASLDNTLISSSDTFFAMKGLKESVILLIFTFTAYLCLIIFSYSPIDPGWSQTSSTSQIYNKGGPAGAWIADLLFSILGITASFLPVFIGLLGCYLWRRKSYSHLHFIFRMLSALGAILCINCLLTLYTSVWPLRLTELIWSNSNLPYGVSGISGNWLTPIAYSVLGTVGSKVVFIGLLATLLSVSTQISFIAFIEYVGKLTFSIIFWGTKITNKIFNVLSYFKFKDLILKSKQKIFLKKTILPTDNNSILAYTKNKNNKPAKPAKTTISSPPKSANIRKTKASPSSKTSTGLPVIELLDTLDETVDTGFTDETIENLSQILEQKLKEFKVEAVVVNVEPGPVVTRFEIDPAPGIKVSQISALAKDLSRSLTLPSLRVVDVIPGKSTVGIEIPNKQRSVVQLKTILSSSKYHDSTAALNLSMGVDISGQPVTIDLSKLPHLLIAGTTGSGKSVGVNAIILSILYRSTPKQVRFIMVDPKMLELSVYEDIPHLLTPVITDMKQAAHSLNWCVAEMERRYKLMMHLGVRNINSYNEKVTAAEKAGQPLTDPLIDEGAENIDEIPLLCSMPYIVVVIDEFADLMMMARKTIEQSIVRIAQKARAAGIHLILATQRPSVDVITGLIKANIPARISFLVASRIDSKVVIDQGGAEQLLGNGDMLYLSPGNSVPQRIHGAFVSDEEVKKVTNFLRQQSEPEYITELTETAAINDGGSFHGKNDYSNADDELYKEAVNVVISTQRVSISGIQRRFNIGYNRAARLVETMETEGIISVAQANGTREVLVKEQ